jgi:hypothetical protein
MTRREWEELNGYGKCLNPVRCCAFCKHSTGRKHYPIKCYLLSFTTKAAIVGYFYVCCNFDWRLE